MNSKKPYGYWKSKENCKKEASKYNTRSEFKNSSNGAYHSSRKNGWLNEICLHMQQITKPGGYWTIERSKLEALKYSTKTRLRINAYQAYRVLKKNNLLETACSHMVKATPYSYLRYTYAIEFPRLKKVYIGVTYNLNERRTKHFHLKDGKSHHKNYRVRKLLNAGEKYLWKSTNKSFHIKRSKEEEERLYLSYVRNGWQPLNIAKLGSTGAKPRKTKNECLIDALKFNSRTEFLEGCPGSYSIARKRKWLDDVCSHMKEKNKPKNYWTKKKCLYEALKYSSKIEFLTNSPTAYRKAYNQNWLGEICKDYRKGRKKNNYWTKEKCSEMASHYEYQLEFRKSEPVAFSTILKNKWYSELCSHLKLTRRINGHWKSIENCRREALKYKSRKEFNLKARGAYAQARSNKWLDEICSHMRSSRKPHGYWTKEKCHEVALKFHSRTEFKHKATAAYSKAVKNKWLQDLCSHM